MKNYKQVGDVVTLTAPTDILSGELCKVGVLCGVAAFDALSGAPVEVALTGVFELEKVSAQAWTQGAAVYMVPGTKLCTTATTAGNLQIGVALEAAANPSATGIVRLNGAAPAAVTI